MMSLLLQSYILWCVLLQTSTSNSGEPPPEVLVLYSSVGQYPLKATIEQIQQPNLKLIFFDLNSTSCEEELISALSTFIQVVFKEDANVISTIGPSCRDSAHAISMLTRREEVSMMHFHVSPMSATTMDLSFEHMSAADLYADACLALISYYQWLDVIALYQDTDKEMNLRFLRLQRRLSKNPSLGLRFNASSLRDSYIPLKSVLSEYHPSRIIFLMLDRELARKTLCLGYKTFNDSILYPKYQWIIVGISLDDILSDGPVGVNGHICTVSDLLEMLNNSVLVIFHSDLSNTDEISDCINDNNENVYLAMYLCSIQAIGNVLNTTGNSDSASLLNMSSALIPRGWQLAIHQAKNNQSHLKAIFNSSLLVIENLTTISSQTEIFFYLASTSLKVAAFFFTTLNLVVIIFLHVLTVIFRNKPSVKAHSPALLHVSYFSVYMVFGVIYVYIGQKSLVIRSDVLYIHLCHVYLLLGNVAYTMVSGTVLVKVWRLYKIFAHFIDPGKFLSDPILVLMVLSLTLVDIVVCMIWFLWDALYREYTEVSQDPDTLKTITQAVCESEFYVFSYLILLTYQLSLLVVVVWLTYLLRKNTPRSQQNFRSTLFVKFAYFALFNIGIAAPLFYLAHYILRSITFEVVVLIVTYNSFLVANAIAQFIPPLWPLLISCLKKYRCACIKHFA